MRINSAIPWVKPGLVLITKTRMRPLIDLVARIGLFAIIYFEWQASQAHEGGPGRRASGGWGSLSYQHLVGDSRRP